MSALLKALGTLAFAIFLPASVEAASCASEIGQQRADVLALQCREVSPATRPPCNAVNACVMIRDEIARGCAMLGTGAPSFCPTDDDDEDEDE